MASNILMQIFFALFPYLIIGGIVILLVKLSSSKPKSANVSSQSSTISIDQIRELQRQGVNSIDELISRLETQTSLSANQTSIGVNNTGSIGSTSATENAAVQPARPMTFAESISASAAANNASSAELTSYSPATSPAIAQTVNVKVPSSPEDSSKVLLYTGSALVTFAMLVLVTLGWNSMSELLKVFLLFANVVGFLVTGSYLLGKEKLKGVGSTFLFVGSLGFMLLMVGVWNFLLVDVIDGQEFAYWVGVSLLSIGLNYALYTMVKEDRFFNLGLFSLYNLIFALAFAISADTNLRVVWLVVFNTLVLLLPRKHLDVKNSESVLSVTRIVNIVGSIAIFFVALGYVGDVMSSFDKLTIVFALSIPVFHGFYDYFVNKSNAVIAEIIMLVAKVLLLTSLYEMGADGVIIILAMMAGVYALMQQFVFKNFSPQTATTAKVMSYIISGYIALSGLYLLLSNGESSLEAVSILIATAVVAVTLLFEPLKDRNFQLAGWLGLIVLLLLGVSIYTIGSDFELGVYSYAYMLVAVLGGITASYFASNSQKQFNELLLPSFYTSLGVGVLLGIIHASKLSESDSQLFLGLQAMIVMVTFAIKYNFEKVLAYRFVIYSTLLLATYLFSNYFYGILDLQSRFESSWLAIIFLIPVVAFWYLFDFAKSKGNSAEIFGYILAGIFALLIASDNSTVLLIVSMVITAISTYRVLEKGSAIESGTLPLMYFANFALFNQVVDIKASGIFALVGLVYIIFTAIIRMRQDKSILKNFEISLHITNGFLLLQYVILMLGSQLNLSYAVGFVAYATAMLLSEQKGINKLAGIPLVAMVWGLLNDMDVNIQFYVVPVTVYLLSIAWMFKRESSYSNFKSTLYFALIFQLFALFVQTVFSGDENIAIASGLVLIFLATVLLILGVVFNDTTVRTFSLIFLALGLFVRLLFVIVLIPWWLYLALLGLALIGYAVFRISKAK